MEPVEIMETLKIVEIVEILEWLWHRPTPTSHHRTPAIVSAIKKGLLESFSF